MCNQLSRFAIEKYVHLKDFLDVQNCKELTAELMRLVHQQVTVKDVQCPKSEAAYGAPVFDELLVDLLPHFEKVSGKRLYPTYSYARMYKQGEELEIHIDRPACEISATITLDFQGKLWPFYIGEKNGKNASKIEMNPGDAVLYRGMEKHHWRKKFRGEWQAQVFLHYVDADGPHKEWKFDKREGLSVPPPANPNAHQMQHAFFTDVLTEQACDSIVKTYTQDAIPKEPPVIGGGVGVINKSIRNVERVMLPTYKDLGGQLAAVGLSANFHHWKFDITHANQAEFLIYPAGGRYTSHVDALLAHGDDCRKLTVLAFLNDDFKGGRFYLQDGHERYYPPQSKGTVLVFPSFILHGVEDVEEGTRYSAVCWMVGKFFK
jgi:predicted 2-oxoglutarate/Fe(II)-dependent dioxygenase YbiX